MAREQEKLRRAEDERQHLGRTPTGGADYRRCRSLTTPRTPTNTTRPTNTAPTNTTPTYIIMSASMLGFYGTLAVPPLPPLPPSPCVCVCVYSA